MPTQPISHRLPPLLLLVVSAAMLIAMAHHPIARGGDFPTVLADMARQATMDRVVHGALIALIALTLLAYVEFSVRLGLGHALVRSALVCYGVGACAFFGAGLIDGFVMSWLAERYATGSAADVDAFRHIARLAEVGGVQSLSSFGVLGVLAAIVCWSLALLTAPKKHRVLGGVGLVLGTLPALALLTGLLELTAHGMLLVLISQVAWHATIAIAWLRGGFDAELSAA